MATFLEMKEPITMSEKVIFQFKNASTVRPRSDEDFENNDAKQTREGMQ